MGIKITDLPGAGALDGTELIEAVQGGVSVKVTMDDLPISAAVAAYLQTLAAKSSVREMVFGAKLLFVRPDGNNANDGSANDSAHAMLTMQAAYNKLVALDGGGNTASIYVADGTYSAGITFTPLVGWPTVNVIGNETTPANCVVSGAALAFHANYAAIPTLTVAGFKITSGVAGSGALRADGGGTALRFRNIDFGAVLGIQIAPVNAGAVTCVGSYTISGGGQSFARVLTGGALSIGNYLCTLVGTPSFSTAFLNVDGGTANVIAASFSGSATGVRFIVANGGAILNTANNANLLPGDTAGTITSGGRYYTTETQYSAPGTGFAVTISNGIQTLILDPAGTLATGTVTMPAVPYDGQPVTILSTQTITTLTHSPNAGQTIKGALTTLAANSAATWQYRSATATWYRKG